MIDIIPHMKKQTSIIIVLSICLAVGLSACKGKEEKPGADGKEATAKALQTLPTPALLPSAKPMPEARAPVEEPKGPVTEPETAPAPLPPPAMPGDIKTMPAPALAPSEVPDSKESMPVPYAPKVVSARTDIEILIDASGSLSAPYRTTSTPKRDIIVNSLFDVISEIAAQQADYPRNIAIRAFGSKSQAGDNNCEDTELVTGFGEPNLDAIKDGLDKLIAQGSSPIAFALTKAAGDFPAEGSADRVIVLIADGSDNCGGNVCDTAVKLEEGVRKFVINVVAFDTTSADQQGLECVAKYGNGKLFAARDENELRTALDQAINFMVPYNFKVEAKAGTIPIPFEIIVYKSGTESIVRRDKSYGTKLLQLPPGSYDIQIDYMQSPESRKPSKIIKGVDIIETTKMEQLINFELGQVMLSALADKELSVPARFDVNHAGTKETAARMEIGPTADSFFLTPGIYDIVATALDTELSGIVLTAKNVEIKMGEAAHVPFKFQKGSVVLKGTTTQKTEIPFVYQVYMAGKTGALAASGALPQGGGEVSLSPGSYEILVLGADPKIAATPRTKISGVEIKPGETSEINAIFEMGAIKLSAVDGQGTKLPAEFILRDHTTQMDMGQAISENGEPVTTPIPPGSYDIVATSLKSALEPRPSVPVAGVVVTADKPAEQVVKFVLGTIRLRGRNAKEQAIETQFTVYRAGTDEKVSAAPPSANWMVFDLAPGTYDALALNAGATDQQKPMIWLRDIKVEDGRSISLEAIYTAGKLKIIGRGPNNQLITCHFKVFQYGADRELISGTTGDDWNTFEIEPGKYYLEASYHDDVKSVMLKKWINLSIGENEVVEEVLRF